MFPVAIVAGGLATRLWPLTEKIPKPLIEVNGEPFVTHQLRLLRKQGITDVVMCTGFLGERIREYVGDGSRFGLRVRYSEDGPTLLGTGGAVRKALPLLAEPFFVLYGDSYLPCDFAAVQKTFEEVGKPGLMTVYANFGNYDRSNVEFSGGRIVTYDKKNTTAGMHHIDYGLGVFAPGALARYPVDEVLDLERVYQDLLAADELAAHEVTQRFYEIGSFSGIRELSDYLSGGTREVAGEACRRNQ